MQIAVMSGANDEIE